MVRGWQLPVDCLYDALTEQIYLGVSILSANSILSETLDSPKRWGFRLKRLGRSLGGVFDRKPMRV